MSGIKPVKNPADARVCPVCRAKVHKNGLGIHMLAHKRKGETNKLRRIPQNGPISTQDSTFSPLTAYAFGHVSAWLEVFARSHGIPIAQLEHELGTLLHASASRSPLGSSDPLPSLQPPRTAGGGGVS